MSDDDCALDGVPPCDECGSEFGALWCDKCSVVLCQECGANGGRHTGHPLGTVGTSDDPYQYDDEADAAAHGDDQDVDPEGDDVAAALMGPDPSRAGRAPGGVITELITEEEAYHVVEMLECNAHISCRRLFAPHVHEHARQMLRERTMPEAHTRAAYMDDEPVRLTPDQWAAFATSSYVVIDNFVDPGTALAAREQTLDLLRGGALTAYRNPKDVGRDDSARSDLRMFMFAGDPASPAAEGPLAVMVRRLEELRAALGEGVALTGEQHEYQLAYYGTQGEHYQKHRDAFPNDGSRPMTGQVGRRVTCTLYMNDYAEGNGGKLRVYVPNAGCTEYTPVEIEPVAGRAVLFLSGAMDHEVLPSFAPRCAIAAWYS